MFCGYSQKLSQNDLGLLTNLEKELGKTILALSCTEVKPSEMSRDQLAKLSDVEKNSGCF